MTDKCATRMTNTNQVIAAQESYAEKVSKEHKLSKMGKQVIENVEEFVNGMMTIANIAGDKVWFKNMQDVSLTANNADDFVKTLTSNKFKTIKELIKDGNYEEVAFVRERAMKTMAYMASNADPVTAAAIRSNNTISKVALNSFDYYHSTMRTQTSKWAIGGSVYVSLGGGKRLDLISNFTRTIREDKPINTIYMTMSELTASAGTLMPKYINATKALIFQYSKGIVTSDMIDRYAHLTDLNQVGWKGEGKLEDFEVKAKAKLASYLSENEGIKTTEDVEVVWTTLKEFKSKWNQMNYGYADPYNIDGKGTLLTKKMMLDPNILQRSFSIVDEKGQTINVPPMLHTVLFLGKGLASIAKQAGEDDEAKKVIALFDPIEDELGWKFRRSYMPSAGENDDMSMFATSDSKYSRLNASPEVLHARKDLNDSNGVRLSDSIVATAQTLNEYVAIRSEYLGMKAMNNIVRLDSDRYIRENKAFYDTVLQYTDRMLEDYDENFKIKQPNGITKYVKRFAYGLLGLQAGVLLTGSAPTNWVAGRISSAMDMPMFFGKESQTALRNRYTQALSSAGLERTVAEIVQNEFKFHHAHEKVSDMVIKDSHTTLSTAKQRLYKELGIAMDSSEKASILQRLGEKFDDLPEGMTRTGEALINKLVFLSENASFNKSENYLLKIGEAYSFDQTNKAMQLWMEGQMRGDGSTPGRQPSAEEITAKTKEFVDKFALDAFNLTKSSMGDFSRYSKPVWAWKTLRDADSPGRVLGGTLLTSMYMFKGVFNINAEVIGKLVTSSTMRAKNLFKKDMTVGTAAIGGSAMAIFALLSLGAYQMLQEFLREDGDDGSITLGITGRKVLPSVLVLDRATPFAPVTSTVALAAKGFGYLANLNGNGNTSESYGREAAGFASYAFGTILGGGFREASNKHYDDIMDAMTGVMTGMKLKFDFGYNYFSTVASGLLSTPADPKDNWKYMQDMSKAADNFIIFNNSNDVLKLGSLLAFSVNKVYNYAISGDQANLANMQNAVTNELKYQTGLYIPIKYASKTYNDDWKFNQLLYKAKNARRNLEYTARRSGYAHQKALRDMEYKMKRFIYGLEKQQKLSFYNIAQGFDKIKREAMYAQ